MRKILLLSSLIFLIALCFCSKENPAEPEDQVTFTTLSNAI